MRIVLKPGRDFAVRAGHPWIFSGAIARVDDAETPGSVGEVLAADGRLLGRGSWNPKTSIAVRMLTSGEEPVDAALVRRRVETALRWRAGLRGSDAWRLVNGEGDQLPGVVVDRYGDFLVAQFLTAGADVQKDRIEVSVWAWGRGLESWLVEHIVIAPINSDGGRPYFRRYPRTAVVVRVDKPDIILSALNNTDTRCLVLCGQRAPMPYIVDRARHGEITVLLSRRTTGETMQALEGVYSASRFQGEFKLERMMALMREHAEPGGALAGAAS